MIKVLHLFTTLDNGGVESFLYNYYSNMNHKQITFDFVVPGDKKGFLEDDLEKMNSKIFRVPRFKKHPFLQIKTLSNIIKNGNYDIIHCHGYKSYLGLLIGKIYKVNVRIMHSHMAYVKENIFSWIIRKFVTFLLKIFATDFFACGIDAAKWLYGNNYYKKGKVKVINNAIDLAKFKFNEKNRKIFRKELCKNNEILIGNIARLTKQKNQIYSLHVIKKLIDDKINVKLLFIGTGEDEKYLQEETKRLGLEKNVMFLGLRNDINNILSGLDVFILPSLYEGLPVVLAEAQASGISCVVSDNITKEIKVTNNIYYLPLNSGCNNWKQKIKKICKNVEFNRLENNKLMEKGKYDIKYQAKKLYKFYYEKTEGNLK